MRIIHLAAVILLVGCAEKDIVVTEVNPVQTGTFEAVVAPLARPTAGGVITIAAYLTYFIADGTFTGLTPSTSLEWKTYFGTCAAKLTPIQIGATSNPPAYPVLRTDAAGAASARATVAGRFKADSSYSIRVYTTAAVTPASPDTVFHACGNVVKK